MVLNASKRHIIISIDLVSKKSRKLSGPYLQNYSRYRAIILHVKFFNDMYQHIQNWIKSKMVIWQGSGDFAWNDPLIVIKVRSTRFTIKKYSNINILKKKNSKYFCQNIFCWLSVLVGIVDGAFHSRTENSSPYCSSLSNLEPKVMNRF